MQVRGVLGSTPERGAARADALGVPRAYDSLETLLAEPGVDVVHVTSPNHLHVPQAAAVLAAGRHVVCEKPLAMTAAESAGLVAQAAASGKVAAVNYNIRFYPLNQHLREVVEDGGLGQVRFVTGHYFQDWLFHESDWNWRLEPGRGGSLRAVGDIGSHWLDLMTFVTGQRVVAVMADLATFVARPPRADRPGRDVLDGPVDRDRRPARWRPRTSRRSSSGSRTVPGAPSPSRRSARGARTRCATRSTGRRRPPRGTPSSPTSCGSATATGRTRSSSATRP